MQNDTEIHWLTTTRIMALTDAIFAVAMTLLILNIEAPVFEVDSTLEGLNKLFQDLAPQLFDYFLSFFLLAIFWTVNHKQFHAIKKANSTLLWINIIALAFVALIPFTTSLSSQYNSYWLVQVLFQLNIFIIGSLFYVNWWYASHNHRLVDKEMSKASIDRGLARNAVVPAVSALAILLSFVMPSWSSIVYLLIPLIFVWIK